MIGLLVMSVIAGAAVFICGLPFALIFSFVYGEISYARNRADYRQTMPEIKAEELAEDTRIDRLIKPSKTRPNIYNDSRHVWLYEAAHD
jgi:hypothetical protein